MTVLSSKIILVCIKRREVDLTLHVITQILGVPDTQEGRLPVSGISIDSRTLTRGMLFFALKGEKSDGHFFVREALKKGASAAVVDRHWISQHKNGQEGILIPVKNPLVALQEVASYYRKRFRFPVIAVTGTNGKTTTKEMLSAVLGMKYSVAKSEGNFNNHIGLPLSICAWDNTNTMAVLEMGTNHFGEIRRLCEIARPTHGVITNVGKGHLEFFGDLKGVLRAKAELVDFLKDRGTVFLNGDDFHLQSFKGIVPQTFMYGFSENYDFSGEELGTDPSGFPKMRMGEAEVTIRVPGSYNLSNGLAAAAVGRHFGVSWEAIKHALESFRPMDKRMTFVRFSGMTVFNDTYNANPTSVQQALNTLKERQEGKRKIVVLGDMLELGKRSRKEHQNIGDCVVQLGLDAFFGFGPAMRSATDRACKLGMNAVVHSESKSDVVEKLLRFVRDGDVILIKGSRGMKMEEIVAGLQEGSKGEKKE